MSDEKVKVHTLAKRFGFKSREFVGVLQKVGYTVSSWQASLDTWDIPIIEERLIKGGLIDAPDTNPEADAAEKAEQGNSDWEVVVETSDPAPADETEAVVEETAEEVEEQDEDEAAPAVAEPTAAPDLEVQSEDTPSPADSDQGDSGDSPAKGDTPSADASPSTPAADAFAPAAEDTPTTDGSAKPTPTPKPSRSPKPRPGATRVGKIDLAALGLVKAAHAKGRGKVTFTDVRNRESNRRRDQRISQRERQKARKGMSKNVSTVARKGDVVLETPVTPKSFSTATGIAVSDLMGKLMGLGVMPTMNTELDSDAIELLAAEFEIGIRLKESEDAEDSLMAEIEAARRAVDDSDLMPRPPVITFMGHVDHGKTSLIDAVRATRIAGGEAGGITQHIGAYTAETKAGLPVTILDTPGHEAFTAMRARGANTTDIAILVVAADDGIMPQTKEAAAQAQKAGVPIVVALNKVDAAGANPEKVKAELASIGLQGEDWGGDTGIIETSALHGTGIDELIERAVLEAEVLELNAHVKGQAHGVVLEALVSEGKGKVSHLLVQDGTLKAGDVVLCGDVYGKVKRIYDQNSKVVKSAGPSTPVEILGLNDMPVAGQRFFVVRDMKAAKEVAEKRALARREQELSRKAVGQDEFLEHIDAASRERLRLVIKADVGGSLEVLRSSLTKLSNDEVLVEIVHSGVGSVTETDVVLAGTAEAALIAFNVSPDGKARRAAEKERVEILKYQVIYELLEEMERRLLEKMGPEYIEEDIGSAEVLQLFTSSRWGTIAGSIVNDGMFKNSSHVRVIRDGKEVHKGKIDSLRHLKDDVREVKAGMECGIKVEGMDNIAVGDILQGFDLIEVAPVLESSSEEDSEE